MEKVVVLSPPAMLNLLTFREMRRQHERFAKFQGVDLAAGMTKLRIAICVTYQVLLHLNSILGIAFMVYEHSHQRTNLLGDCRCIIIILGTVCMACCGLFLFMNQDRLNILLDYCERLLPGAEFNERRLLRVVRVLHQLAFIIPFNCSVGILVIYLIFHEKRIPIPIYYPEILLEKNAIYVVVCLYQSTFNLIFWLYNCFFLSTYIILVEHISGQYTVLSELVRRLSDEQKIVSDPSARNHLETSAKIDEIGRLHTELLANLKEASRMFKQPLIFNEGFVIMCTTVSVTTFLYEFSDAVFAFECVGLTAGCLMYPFLGEKISSNAGEFVDAFYECDWLKLSPSHRKRVGLMLMMAQRPVGFNSGGFHFSNYLEIAQILRCVYNLQIFIKQRYEIKGF